jgi:hypothetical protein
MSKIIDKIKSKAEGGSGLTQGTQIPKHGLLKEDSIEKGSVDLTSLKGKSQYHSITTNGSLGLMMFTLQTFSLAFQAHSARPAPIRFPVTLSMPNNSPPRVLKEYMLLPSTMYLS